MADRRHVHPVWYSNAAYTASLAARKRADHGDEVDGGEKHKRDDHDDEVDGRKHKRDDHDDEVDRVKHKRADHDEDEVDRVKHKRDDHDEDGVDAGGSSPHVNPYMVDTEDEASDWESAQYDHGDIGGEAGETRDIGGEAGETRDIGGKAGETRDIAGEAGETYGGGSSSSGGFTAHDIFREAAALYKSPEKKEKRPHGGREKGEEEK